MLKNTTRRNTPHLPSVKNGSQLQRYLCNVAKKHDVRFDPNIAKTRTLGKNIILYFLKGGKAKYQKIPPRCENIRPERAETMNALLMCFIMTCDFSIDSEYLFEINYPIEFLAKLIGQHHKYDNGRVSIDCVRNAITDFEMTGYLHILREPCKETGKNKANRLFLTPKFFNSFGVTTDELVGLMENLRNYRLKNKTLNQIIEKNQAQFLRRKQNTQIAGLWRSDLSSALSKIKSLITSKRALLLENRKLAKERKAIKAADKARETHKRPSPVAIKQATSQNNKSVARKHIDDFYKQLRALEASSSPT